MNQTHRIFYIPSILSVARCLIPWGYYLPHYPPWIPYPYSSVPQSPPGCHLSRGSTGRRVSETRYQPSVVPPGVFNLYVALYHSCTLKTIRPYTLLGHKVNLYFSCTIPIEICYLMGIKHCFHNELLLIGDTEFNIIRDATD